MNVKNYLGDLIGGSLMISESRIIAELQLKKLPDEEWRNLIIEHNILQKKSVHTSIRYARMLRARLEKLNEELITLLINYSERAYIQMMMVTLLLHSPIVEDFMRQSLAEARRTYKPTLPENAWLEFYDARARAFPELGQFSDTTIRKMGNNAVKALVDSDYLSNSRTRKIQPVYLLPEVKECLQRLGREELLDVLECTV